MKRIILLTICVAFFLSGCSGATIYSDYRELETLELIRTVGIDVTENGIKLTVGTGVGIDGTSTRVYQKESDTLSRALDELQRDFVKEDAFFAHTEHIVIGEEAAKKGIQGYLDFIAREMEMRLSTNLFVVVGASAEEAIVSVAGEKSAAADMLTALREDVTLLSEGYVYSSGDVIINLAREGHSLVMAIEVADSNEVATDVSSEKVLVPAGYVVLRDGKTLGHIDSELAGGVGIFTGKMDNERIVVSDGDGGKITLILTKTKLKINPEYKDKEIKSVNLEIDMFLSIDEVETNTDISSDSVRKYLAKQVEQQERERQEGLIALARELDTDFCNIGRKIEMKMPVKFAKLQTQWEDAFADMTFNININASIVRTYDLNNPIGVGGEDGE